MYPSLIPCSHTVRQKQKKLIKAQDMPKNLSNHNPVVPIPSSKLHFIQANCADYPLTSLKCNQEWSWLLQVHPVTYISIKTLPKTLDIKTTAILPLHTYADAGPHSF